MEPNESSNTLFNSLANKNPAFHSLVPLWNTLSSFENEKAIVFIIKYFIISKVNEELKKNPSQDLKNLCHALVKDLSQIRNTWKEQSQEEKYSYMNISFYLYVQKLDDQLDSKQISKDLLMK